MSTAAVPRAVTRGESLPEGFAVSVDWLAFTYTPMCLAWETDLCSMLADGFGVVEPFTPSERGWQGYSSSARVGGVLVAWGGEGQRGTVHVEIPGRETGACENWPAVVDWLSGWSAKLTRIDIAGDDYFGSEVTVEKAVEWFRAGRFNGQGRPPSARLVDDLGSQAGKTLYVGSRAAGKVARIYEKGRQLGSAISPWVRFEVEWRARCRVLSVDMLLRPAEFLSGAFECASFWSGVRQSIRTIKNRAKISYETAVAHARAQCGKVVSMILQATHGDVWSVVSLLRRSGLPSRINERELIALSG